MENQLVKTLEQFEEIMESKSQPLEGVDKILFGMKILDKFTDNIISGVDRDIIHFNPEISDMIDQGINILEVEQLRDSKYHINDYDSLSIYI